MLIETKSTIQLYAPQKFINTQIALPSSKSESNRALIIRALAKYQSSTHIFIDNLSEARDTQTLQKLLNSNEETLDVIDAGTTMRFLTAFLAATNQSKILTGTARMCERPIGILVDALRELGFSIDYLQNEGFPPIKVDSQVPKTKSQKSKIKIRGDVSSQYISALLMIAPLLPEGLTLELEGKISSRPYIEMTLEQMSHFGIDWSWQENIIQIPASVYQAKSFAVESDWSGASYWYSIIALAENAAIELLGLKPQSLQGDSAICEIMQQLGVQTTFTTRGVLLQKKAFEAKENLCFDFNKCPDLAQTVIALCAAQKIKAVFTGIESLRIKETDRIFALQTELQKIGVILFETQTGFWSLNFQDKAIQAPLTIQTYQDHRMAMAFAPLSLCFDLKIENPEVVKKSYPYFWKDLEKAGFRIE